MNNSMIIELFDDCKNTSDFIRIICDNFQGWLITKSDKYSDDYTCLQDNWFRLTQNLNIQSAASADHLTGNIATHFTG